MTEMTNFSAYREGFAARLRGEKVQSNPHAPATEAWRRWLSGWRDQDHHLNDRDEALDSIGWFG